MEIKRKTSHKGRLKEAYVLIILVGTILILNVFSDGKFLSNASITNVLRVSVAPLVVATVATLLMITGNVDLSVGSIVGLVATVYAILAQTGIPLVVAMLIVIVLGCACGWINGLLVTKLNITPVIVTLATMSLFLGIAKLLIPDEFDIIKYNMPDNMLVFAKGNVFAKIPPSIFVSIVVVVFFVFMQKRSTLGKYSVAIGGNKVAAALAGINVQRTVWMLYVLVGAVSAIGGITRASYMQSGDPDVGYGLEVQVIIAILLGGASFSGGKGSILNTVAAVYIMICLDKGLTLVGVASYWSMLINGMVFIVALVVNNAMKLNEIKQKKKAEICSRMQLKT